MIWNGKYLREKRSIKLITKGKQKEDGIIKINYCWSLHKNAKHLNKKKRKKIHIKDMKNEKLFNDIKGKKC